MPSPLPLRLTLDELAHLAEPRPEVELHGLDMGWYIVRLHRDDSVSLLSTAQGDTQRFSGTQWVSRALAPLGFTHGTLTWAEAADEMIGHPTPPSLTNSAFSRASAWPLPRGIEASPVAAIAVDPAQGAIPPWLST